MARTILIVGGLTITCSADAVLHRLNQRTAREGIAWQWAKADLPAYRLPPRHPLVNTIAYGPKDGAKDVTLVMLRYLNKDDKNRLLKKRPDPVLVPRTVTTDEELISWLLSSENGLVPLREWVAEAREAAFFAILAKLLKNKDWANTIANHNFTQEADLLGQSPVNVHPEVRGEASHLLDKMNGVLLLAKGGSQGNTKKEWAIYQPRLAAVMDAFLKQSIEPLQGQPGLDSLLEYIGSGKGREFRLNEFVDVERVRSVCRPEKPEADKSK